MFTGLVEGQGTVAALRPVGDGAPPGAAEPLGARLTIAADWLAGGVAPGSSIAVNGCCLTAAAVTPDGFAADLVPETLRRTALGRLAVGDAVNLERPLAAGDRLGGHLVQGHVDGVGTILARQEAESWHAVRIALPAGLARYVVTKGSITVDGVSLTVVDVTDEWFSVGLIPTTLALTTLGRKRVGDPVNLEVDVIAKYVEKLLSARAETSR